MFDGQAVRSTCSFAPRMVTCFPNSWIRQAQGRVWKPKMEISEKRSPQERLVHTDQNRHGQAKPRPRRQVKDGQRFVLGLVHGQRPVRPAGSIANLPQQRSGSLTNGAWSSLNDAGRCIDRYAVILLDAFLPELRFIAKRSVDLYRKSLPAAK